MAQSRRATEIATSLIEPLSAKSGSDPTQVWMHNQCNKHNNDPLHPLAPLPHPKRKAPLLPTSHSASAPQPHSPQDRTHGKARSPLHPWQGHTYFPPAPHRPGPPLSFLPLPELGKSQFFDITYFRPWSLSSGSQPGTVSDWFQTAWSISGRGQAQAQLGPFPTGPWPKARDGVGGIGMRAP